MVDRMFLFIFYLFVVLTHYNVYTVGLNGSSDNLVYQMYLENLTKYNLFLVSSTLHLFFFSRIKGGGQYTKPQLNQRLDRPFTTVSSLAYINDSIWHCEVTRRLTSEFLFKNIKYTL